MKRNIIVILLAVAVLLTVTPMLYAKTPGEKFLRGVANSLSGILEVPKQICVETKESKNYIVGPIAGFAKGAAFGLMRTVSGLWDVFTFPIQAPAGYEPLMKPDYVFQTEECTTKTTTTK